MKIYEELKLTVYELSGEDIVRTSDPDKEDMQDDVFFTTK